MPKKTLAAASAVTLEGLTAAFSADLARVQPQALELQPPALQSSAAQTADKDSKADLVAP